MKILVSACLLAYPCRYDGKSKPCEEVVLLKKEHTLIPVCPEELGGLKTPRIPAEIKGDRVVRQDGKDVTLEYNLGAEKTLQIAKEQGIFVAILKSKSPSCGNKQIYDGNFEKRLIDGKGITARLLENNNIKVISENELEEL
ncbi:MAG: DUF523 domain-containing protein [Clostridia bacterium]|nr:DUF523 domain-containing protein [Clostridia bacterium]